MSLELKEAREKLNIIERLSKEPQLVFTDLYKKGTQDCNFLYQVNVQGKYILDYFIDHVKTIPVFDNTIPKIEHSDLVVYVPSLQDEKHNKYKSKDKILEIDLEDRTFIVCEEDLNEYLDVMNSKYELKTYGLDDFWKKYENFSFKKRVENAFISLTTNQKRFRTKVADFAFHFIVSKKKINNVLQREKEKVEKKNEYNRKRYDENISLQNFFTKNAPEHLEKAIAKQKEIVDYLIKLGYSEYVEMEG